MLLSSARDNLLITNCHSLRVAVFYFSAGCFCHPRAVACACAGERVGTFCATRCRQALRPPCSSVQQEIICLFKLPFFTSGSFLLSGGLLLSSPSGCLCLRRRASGDILRHEVPSGASLVAHLSSARDNLLFQLPFFKSGSFFIMHFVNLVTQVLHLLHFSPTVSCYHMTRSKSLDHKKGGYLTCTALARSPTT